MLSIYAGTAVKVSMEVRKVSDSSLVDPTTLALIISPSGSDSTTATVKAIADLTRASTGLYSYVHHFAKSTTPGNAYITAYADAAVDVSAILNETTIHISRPKAAQGNL